MKKVVNETNGMEPRHIIAYFDCAEGQMGLSAGKYVIKMYGVVDSLTAQDDPMIHLYPLPDTNPPVFFMIQCDISNK